MKGKPLYTYDHKTGTFKLAGHLIRPKWVHAVMYIASGVFAGIVIYVLLNTLTESDRNEALKMRNRQLEQEIANLQKQTDDAMGVLSDIAERDNNFYRVLMQADPITDYQRFATMRQRASAYSKDSINDNELLATLKGNIDRLESQLYSQSKSFDFIRSEAVKRKGRLDYLPAIQPISFDQLERIASGFGHRSDPIYGTSKMHEGLDYTAAIGTPVFATARGRVSYAGWRNGYGNCIYIDHGYDYETRFAHLSQIDVRVGQTVERGQMIGRVGNSGKSTGPHLHYEVRYKDRPQNPIHYYFYDMTPEQYDDIIRQAANAGHVMD